MDAKMVDPNLYHLATQAHKKEFDALTQQRADLLAACEDLIHANAYARRVSLRDEPPRGSVWGEARSVLDAAKLKAQRVISKAKSAIAAADK